MLLNPFTLQTVWNGYYSTRLLGGATLTAVGNRGLDAGVYCSHMPPQFDHCRLVALSSWVGMTLSIFESTQRMSICRLDRSPICHWISLISGLHRPGQSEIKTKTGTRSLHVTFKLGWSTFGNFASYEESTDSPIWDYGANFCTVVIFCFSVFVECKQTFQCVLVGWEWSCIIEPQIKSFRRWTWEVSIQLEDSTRTNTWADNVCRWQWKVWYHYQSLPIPLIPIL